MDIYFLASTFLNLWGKTWLHKVEIQKCINQNFNNKNLTYFKFNFLNSRSVLTIFSIKKKKREMKYSVIMDNRKTGLMWYENILLCADSICSLSEYVSLWSLSTFGFSFRLPFGFSNCNYIVSQSLIIRVWQTGVLNYQRTYSDPQACAFLFVSIWPILL